MKKARKILFTLCAALLLVTMSVGATLAYLSSTDTVTNTFTTGKVEILLDEAQVDKATNENYYPKASDGSYHELRTDENEYTMYPGGHYHKDPVIHVLADSEECYVAAKIVLTTKTDLTDLIPAENGFIGFKGMVNGGVFDQTFETAAVENGALVAKNAEWKLVQFPAVQNGENYTREFHIFKLKTVAKSTECQDFVLFKNIEIPETWNNDQVAKLNGMTMDITAYGVQEAGMAGCEDAMAKAGYITK